jgi:hypothetical protein
MVVLDSWSPSSAAGQGHAFAALRRRPALYTHTDPFCMQGFCCFPVTGAVFTTRRSPCVSLWKTWPGAAQRSLPSPTVISGQPGQPQFDLQAHDVPKGETLLSLCSKTSLLIPRQGLHRTGQTGSNKAPKNEVAGLAVGSAAFALRSAPLETPSTSHLWPPPALAIGGMLPSGSSNPLVCSQPGLISVHFMQNRSLALPSSKSKDDKMA